MKRRHAPYEAKPPGWWLEPVLRRTRALPCGFPANWHPGLYRDFDEAARERSQHATLASEAARERREVMAREGRGWGSGTIPMNGTPKRRPPGWLRTREA